MFPQNDLMWPLALCWEIEDSKCDMCMLVGHFGPLHMELMCGSSWLYLSRHGDCSFVAVSKRCMMEMCGLIGVISLLSWKPCDIRFLQVIIFITKSGAALVLAFSKPSPPLLMLRWDIRVEYVGSSYVGGRPTSSVINSLVMESMPSVRCPFQLYHCSLSNSAV